MLNNLLPFDELVRLENIEATAAYNATRKKVFRGRLSFDIPNGSYMYDPEFKIDVWTHAEVQDCFRADNGFWNRIEIFVPMSQAKYLLAKGLLMLIIRPTYKAILSNPYVERAIALLRRIRRL